MSVPFVDLKAQYYSIKDEVDAAIFDSIENSTFIGGEAVRNFEEAFASYIGVKHCIGCANGTDSLELILQAYEIGKGDEVIVPANSWVSSAEVVNNVGAEPTFVDVIPDEFTINPNLIESKITKRTKAIILVHLYGLSARLDEIMSIAAKNNLLVIEDAAQAHGATYKGKKVGAIGQIASFSFYPGKNLGAYGDAGCVVTNDDKIAQRVRMIGNHGQLSKHDHQIIGRNSRLDTMQARVLSVKLKYLDEWIEKRIANAKYYSDHIDHSEVTKPVTPDFMKHVYHLYVIKTDRRATLQKAFKANGIGHSIHYPTPLPLLQSYSYQKHSVSDFPSANKNSKEILSLPMYPELSKDQMDRVISIINSI